MISIGDPVRAGLVPSLARPGGNITGNTILGPDVGAKRLQILKEAIPTISRVAFLWNPDNASNVLQFQEVQAAAPTLGVTVISVSVSPRIEFETASSTMIDELIDLTKMQPSKVLRTRFAPTDLMWIVVVGGVPYLAREAFRYLFPGRPTVVDQLKVLAELIAAAGEAKAKSLKVRISTGAKTRWEMPESIQEANVLGENDDTIDLEIVFNPRRSLQC